MSGMASSNPQAVRVMASPSYVPEQSNPTLGHYLFAYRIEVRNDGERPVQLLARHWIITNGEGRVEEVRGDGVVGQQPRLAPGETFSYSSACPLDTPVGTMHGSFRMTDEEGHTFDVPIQPFRLAVPGILN